MTQETKQIKQFDVIVVGGGMTGAAMALGLAQYNFHVALVEMTPPDLSWDATQAFGIRVSALTRASQNVLTQLGAWEDVLARRYHAFTDMHVCEASHSDSVHFSAAEIEEANLGYVVENDVIQAALWSQFDQFSNLEVFSSQKVTDLARYDDAGVPMQKVKLEASCLSAPLVVGADGARSQVRELSGIGVDAHSYDQCAVVGGVKTELFHQNTCWQRYTEQGPFAYLSMDDNVSSIAWYLPLEKQQWALSLDDDAFKKALETASGGLLGKVVEVYDRGAFPLTRTHATHYVKPAMALIGDAAHTIHPQAGQGVNLGFLDVAALIEVLVEARNASQSSRKHWARVSVLRKYERWRRGDNALVQTAMEVFDSTFDQNASLKTRLRKVLMPVADKAKFLKNWLMAQALYGRGEMPKLSKNRSI